ncbi:MAG TPA: hypothetical protein EYH21_03590 [Methanothermococcus okinawensis]|uniref:Lon proteolytic domain-containing protein n=1 Tax=Methanothermococcus okinawensis TaxID=155863 RepID=A0A832ZKU9_9EURY|nr:hypothetical protein [Methanothermococcus okinawensis]
MRKYLLLLIIPLSLHGIFGDVTIAVPAVSKTDYGYVGTTINIDVKVSNGSGHVFIDTLPVTEMDMQSSARVAAKVAFDISNRNQKDYDVYYIVRSKVPIIGGPSAGGALCVATVAELNNWSINRDVMMTGMIYPDGGIGPVGGILEKLKSAKMSGARYFLIPYGERYITVEDPYLEGGNITVDVVEYGRELGIEVIEVRSIYDAIYYFTNHSLVEENYTSNPVLESIYRKKMKELADKVLKLAEDHYRYVSNRLERDPSAKLSYLLEMNLKRRLEESREELEIGEKLYSQGNYYSATSKAFGVIINLEAINTTLNYMESSDKRGYLKDYLVNIQEDIKDKKEIIRSRKLIRDNFEYILASKSRIYEGEDLMDSAWREYYNDNPLAAIEYASYGKWRGESAIWWLQLSNRKSNLEEEVIEEYQLMPLAQKYLDNAEVVVLYSSMILPEIGGIEDAEEKLERAREYYERGEYLLSIGESIDAYVYATTYLNFNTDTGYLRERAEKRINKVMGKYNYLPISAMGYYEYANSFNDSFYKALYYKYSTAYAQMDIDILQEIGHNYSYQGDVFITGNLSSSPGEKPGDREVSSNISLGIISLFIGLSCGIFLGYFIRRDNS